MRAWITGLGAVSAAGVGIERTLETFSGSGRALESCSGLFPGGLERPVFSVALADTPGLSCEFPSRTARLACLAIDEALQAAGSPHQNAALRIGVCLGTTVASQLNSLEFYRDYRESGCPDLTPVHDFLSGNLADFVARRYGLHGPRSVVVNACSSGADAIGTALGWLRRGLCDIVIAGGADELNRVPLAGFNSLGIMSECANRPFDRDRDGLNLGEGAGVLILESESRRFENARLFLAGYGAACDSHHLTAPDPEGLGLKIAIREALEQAEVAPGDIAFVNAHGTSTPDNDRVEGRVLADVFGTETPFCSTKSRTGHTLGAAGGLEAVFTGLGLICGWIPATLGFVTPDPEILVAPTAQSTPVQGTAALSTSLAFGGNNSALVLRLAARA